MNKQFRRFLWLLPIFVGTLVFIGGGIYYMNGMQQVAGEGNFSPVDAFLLSLHDAAIASLLAVQVSIMIGFAWWAVALALSAFGKNARHARATQKAQQAAVSKDDPNEV